MQLCLIKFYGKMKLNGGIMSKKKELVNLYQESFDDTPEYVKNFFAHYYTKQRAKCIVENGVIVSSLYLLPKHIRFSNKVLKVFFIVAGSTRKEYRNKGYYKRLLRKTVEDCAERNAPFVLLYPTSHQLYEQSGFATVSMVSQFVAHYDGYDATLVEATSQDLLDIFNDYLDFDGIRQFRTHKEIKKLIKRWASEDILPECYERGGRRCYVACSSSEIEEAIGDLTVLNGVKKFDAKQFVDYFGDSVPYVMARMASPVALLKSIEYNKISGRYCFKIIDDLCPSNNVVLSICFENKKLKIDFATRYDFEINCQDLIRLAFGANLPDCPLNEIIKKKEVVIIDKY